MRDTTREQLDARRSARLSEAFTLASRLHRNQTRKRAADEQDTPAIPYIAHLMAVAALVLEHGGDENEAIAALLHDGPEDQGGQATLDDIRGRFGDRVADIVEGCSDTLVADPDDKPPWRARKESYLDHLRETTSDSVFLVSLCDKVHNLGSIRTDYRRIGGALWERFTGKRDGTLWYYGKLLRAYREKAPPRCADLVAEFERIYLDLDAAAGRNLGAPD